MGVRRVALVACWLSCCSSVWAGPEAGSRAAGAEGKWSVPVVRFAGTDLAGQRLGGIEYVKFADVVGAVGGKWWCVERSFIAVVPAVDKGMEEWVFRADSLSAHVAGARVRLHEPCLEFGGRLLVPVSALGLLSGVDSRLAVRSARGWCRAETVAVEVLFEGKGTKEMPAVRKEQVSSLEYRVSLAARADSGLEERLAGVPKQTGGLVRRVVVDTSSSTALTFVFDRSVRVRERTLGEGEKPGVRNEGFGFEAWPRPSRAIGRVILDPGHGGKDPGAVSARGTLEKRVVLDVTNRLKKKLERAGFEVVLTRSSDTFVSLADRTRLGNGVERGGSSNRDSGGSVFVSVHANASPNRSACGFEAYFLSEAKSDWERAVAARENAAFELAGPGETGEADDVGMILADLAQNEFLWESSELAARIQEATVPHARIFDRGVRQASFYVLRNTFMPAVLVECGFLSNRSEDKLLRTEAHRERLAEGICRGIVAFGRKYQTEDARNGGPKTEDGGQRVKGRNQGGR